MTPYQISLVRASFAKILPVKAQAAALFYERLFQVAPQTRSMFGADVAAQGAKLMAALSMVVMGLDRLETITPQIRDLARRHSGYGVVGRHYALVGETLLWTLEQGLGRDFTPAVREAWAEAYDLLAETMIVAARQTPEGIVAAA